MSAEESAGVRFPPAIGPDLRRGAKQAH